MEAKKQRFVLPKGALLGGDFARTRYTAVIPYGTPFEEILEPEYWAFHGNVLRAGDHIECEEQGGAYYAHLQVRQTGINAVHVREVYSKRFETDALEEPEAMFDVKWAGPAAKYRVIRTSDGKVIKEGIEDKSVAFREAKDAEAAARR
jgi:hypothetical protein